MDHRAMQVIAAFVSRITGLQSTGNRVYLNRTYEIEEDTRTAINVMLGEETPQGEFGFSSMDRIDNVLEIIAEIRVRSSGDSIDSIILQIRKEMHIALMSWVQSQTYPLGLDFVYMLYPAGTGNPEIESVSEKPTAKIETLWKVHYRHSILDPSI